MGNPSSDHCDIPQPGSHCNQKGRIQRQPCKVRRQRPFANNLATYPEGRFAAWNQGPNRAFVSVIFEPPNVNVSINGSEAGLNEVEQIVSNPSLDYGPSP